MSNKNIKEQIERKKNDVEPKPKPSIPPMPSKPIIPETPPHKPNTIPLHD